MNSALKSRIALVAASAAIVGMAALTGCSSSTKEAPKTTSPASSSAPALSPTEKSAVTQPLVPSVENRGGMDSAPCGPGKAKVNGVCQ